MKRVAIVGTGVAGMVCGYYLHRYFDVSFYEKNDYCGGHTNTRMVEEDGGLIPIDTGFIVYNEVTYPNLIRFFDELNIQTKPTSMSFSVQHVPSGLEYCGSGWAGLFAQRKNILSGRFWKMLLDINRFNKECLEVLDNEDYQKYRVDDYVREKGYGAEMVHKYLVPMCSAVWSTEPGLILKFPLLTLVRFFKNHCFLGLSGQHQWRTVVGGSRVYRDKIMDGFSKKTYLPNAVVRITRESGCVVVEDSKGVKNSYDHVVLACHADESLAILGDQATPLEQSLLAAFRYQKNHALLHTDESVMPKTKLAWSSWNYRMDEIGGVERPSTIYSMNSLQQVSKNKEYFVSINDPGLVDPRHKIWETYYDHPIYDLQSLWAQGELQKLNHNGQIYFCGGYFRYGFHEDALTSGLQVVKAMTGETFGYSL